MKYINIIIIILLINKIGYASNQNQFKHDVIAACMKFINQDKKLFENNVTQKYDGQNISDLKEHYSKLTNATNKIDDINNYPLNDSSIDVSSQLFIKNALDEITKGEKTYRKTALYEYSYEDLTKDLNILRANHFKIGQVSNSTNSSKINNNQTPMPVIVYSDQLNKNEYSNYSYSLIAITISIFSILLSFVALYLTYTNKNKYKELITGNNIAINNQLDKINFELNKIENAEYVSKAEMNLHFNNSNSSTYKKTNISESPDIQNKEIVFEKPTLKNDTKKNIKYVRSAEFSNGFNADSFKKNPDSQSVFIITIMDDTHAEFEVNSDPNIQKLAISNFTNYFSNVCEFTELSNNNTSKITTSTKGKLVLKNNIWEVVAKAHIKLS